MHSPTFSHYRQVLRAVADLSLDFPPVRSRALGCRHAHRDGVSLFGRAAFRVRPRRPPCAIGAERAGVAPVQKAALEPIENDRGVELGAFC